MQAYLNDPALKERVLTKLRAHYDADEIIQGIYWKEGKGCAVGCILHDLNKKENNHELFESALGIPEKLAYLIDRIFEGLPNKEAKIFPINIMQSISVGKDLSMIWPHFAIWLLNDVSKCATKPEKMIVNSIVNLYQRTLKLEVVTIDEWFSVYVLASDSHDEAYAAAPAYVDDYACGGAVIYACAAAPYSDNAGVYADACGAYAVLNDYASYEKMASKLIEIISQ